VSYDAPDSLGTVSLPANFPTGGAALSVTIGGYAFGSFDASMAARVVNPEP
jgi:hypothetical protein